MTTQTVMMSSQELKTALRPAREYFTSRTQKAILRIFLKHLPSSDDVPVKAKKIATNLQAIITADESLQSVSERFWDLWEILLSIVNWAPPDHLLQDTLLLVVVHLAQLDGLVTNPESDEMKWENLPNLIACIRDHWFNPTHLDDFTEEDVSKWKNTSSFIARYSALDPLEMGSLYPLATVRDALEEPVPNGPKMDCGLWVATEWIMRYGPALYWFLTTQNTELDEQRTRAFRLGSLCEEKTFPLISVDRWHYWKKRLEDISENWDDFELESATPERIEQAIQVMNAVENGTLAESQLKDKAQVKAKSVEDEKHVTEEEEEEISLWKRIRSTLQLPWKWCKLFMLRCRLLLGTPKSSGGRKSRVQPLKNKFRNVVKRW
ncbi:hypothetical protein PT974_05287 [Cladobotryum mycophilum]|uniref:Uncharacterized protein n=1 Tax=Cladobotryum mycophilum TaxID=491253 RepID=A0ABR0SI99_9HYPO